jgi:cyclase
MALEPRVIPSLLLSGAQLVKTRRFAEPAYVGDPVNVLSIFNSFEVDEIILLDIDGARRRTPAALDQLSQYAEECFIPLAYGGGLSSVEEMRAVLAAGYEKVIVNSLLAEEPTVVADAADALGSQAVVASIDVRGRDGGASVWVRGGTVDVGHHPVAWATRAAALGIGEIMLTSIDAEGTMQGYDLELIREVADAVDVPLIAHGGAGRRADLGRPIRDAGASAVAAGSLFVFQRSRESVLINYPSRVQIEHLLAEVQPSV